MLIDTNDGKDDNDGGNQESDFHEDSIVMNNVCSCQLLQAQLLINNTRYLIFNLATLKIYFLSLARKLNK